MGEILDIAIADYQAKKKSPLLTVTVDEWKDANGNPVKLSVMRIGPDDASEIAAARKENGELGGIVMTIIKQCYLFSDNKTRAFADTDFTKMMKKVDPEILKRIYNQIAQVTGGF